MNGDDPLEESEYNEQNAEAHKIADRLTEQKGRELRKEPAGKIHHVLQRIEPPNRNKQKIIRQSSAAEQIQGTSGKDSCTVLIVPSDAW